MYRQLIQLLTLVSLVLISDYAFADIEFSPFLKNASSRKPVKPVAGKLTPVQTTVHSTTQSQDPPATVLQAVPHPQPEEQKKSERFEIIGNGDVVLDRTRRLYWVRNANIGKKLLQRNEATALIDGLNGIGYGGYRNWRLPTEDEFDILLSIARKDGYAALGKPAADFLNSRLPFHGFQQGLYYGKKYKANFSGEPWDDVEKRQAGLGAYLIPVRDEYQEAVSADAKKISNSVLESIENYRAPTFPVSEYFDRETFDYRIKHGKPNPASFKDALACDLYSFMTGNRSITRISKQKVSLIDLLLTITSVRNS